MAQGQDEAVDYTEETRCSRVLVQIIYGYTNADGSMVN